MIINNKQCSSAKTNIQLIREKIHSNNKQNKTFEEELQIELWEQQILDIEADINEYLEFKNCSRLHFSFENLEKSIVAARISSGITQKELASKIGVKEQQIQRYEYNNYLTASFERVIQIVKVLSNRLNLTIDTRQRNVLYYNFSPQVNNNCKIVEAQMKVQQRQSIVNFN